MAQRIISKIIQNPWKQGFLGKGHEAKAVSDGVPYQDSDPFILFMDDRLNLPGGEPVGGAHPHAGFETLTLVLKGNEKDWQTGSFELMTAGKGIVHTEEITSQQNLQILQVWLALPPEKRWTEPFWQKISPEDVPALKTEQYEIKVYSGSSNGLTSPLINLTPLTLVDFKLQAKQTVVQQLPSDYSGLIYVLEGSVQIGNQTIESGQAGWLTRYEEQTTSEIQFQSLKNDTHFVLYAAQPHHAPLVQHGPFVGDTREDIVRLYKEYRNGAMPHLNNLASNQKINYSHTGINNNQLEPIG